MIKKIKNSKYFPIIIVGLTLFIIIVLLIIKSLVTGVTVGKYGNRLKGIKNVPFNSSSQKKVKENISSNEKASNVKIFIKGKIINIMFNVTDDTSKDDAKNIANGSLKEISSKVKKFYDIQVFITKTTEKGTEQQYQTDDGKSKTQIVKEFPIVGYKNSKSNDLIW